ncbi:hypothetical protein H6G06_21370 [Anabaena sphaerica FACHB-251]|uniref:Uncharacterized protein n=1 Tax=Anabaena sphaerica FACHB-251 TaxID=2692883 RepID=A0A927A3Z3_9NOST|nr:hypothetical protein [Anabaena sphaerica]MBD2295955.1 hypothetical protein [Anabaena sphaerica FACHB-251]
MNNFNFKSLAISGVAITSVLILFKTVTAYGENHLRATSLIHNRYHLTLAKNLPNCEKVNSLVLNIQQSGIYLNASLLTVNANTDTKTQLPLTGILKNQQLELSGKIDSSIFCQTPSVQNSQIQPITIQMSQLNNDNIPGQLKINNIPTTLEFTALPQTEPKATTKSESH